MSATPRGFLAVLRMWFELCVLPNPGIVFPESFPRCDTPLHEFIPECIYNMLQTQRSLLSSYEESGDSNAMRSKCLTKLISTCVDELGEALKPTFQAILDWVTNDQSHENVVVLSHQLYVVISGQLARGGTESSTPKSPTTVTIKGRPPQSSSTTSRNKPANVGRGLAIKNKILRDAGGEHPKSKKKMYLHGKDPAAVWYKYLMSLPECLQKVPPRPSPFALRPSRFALRPAPFKHPTPSNIPTIWE